MKIEIEEKRREEEKKESVPKSIMRNTYNEMQTGSRFK